MIKKGTALRGVIHVAQPIHLKAEGVVLTGQLRLEDGTAREQSSSHQASCFLWDHGGSQKLRGEERSNVTGVVEGLCTRHYMEPAIWLNGGSWQLIQCELGASRRGARASTAIDMREGSSLSLLSCTVQQSCTAVRVDVACSLEAYVCAFVNCKEAIVTRGGGGLVVIETCTFTDNEIALKLDDSVRGRATGNTIDGSMLGPWEKPDGFRVMGNDYAAGVVNEDVEDEPEPDDVLLALAAASEAQAAATAAPPSHMEAPAPADQQSHQPSGVGRVRRQGGGGAASSSSSSLAPPTHAPAPVGGGRRPRPKIGVEHGFWRCVDDPEMGGTCTREHVLR